MARQPIKTNHKAKPISFDKDWMRADPSGVLNDQEKRFCHYYIETGYNGRQSAEYAGYPSLTNYDTAVDLLKREEIVKYIELLRDDLATTLGLARQKIAMEIAKIAFFDIRKLYNEDGRLKNMHELDDATAAAVSSVETTELPTWLDGIERGWVRKVKMQDKLKALEALARMFGFNEPDKKQMTGPNGGSLMPAPILSVNLPQGMNINLPNNTDGEPEP